MTDEVSPRVSRAKIGAHDRVHPAPYPPLLPPKRLPGSHQQHAAPRRWRSQDVQHPRALAGRDGPQYREIN